MADKDTTVRFPSPSGISVNMMPFVPVAGLPRAVAQYDELVRACGVSASPRVYFLTVSEHAVSTGTHRRGGVHTEGQRGRKWGGSAWGGKGGVWMASTVANSCRVWDCEVGDSDLGIGGCCDHLDLAGVTSRTLAAGEVANFSDRTPHESVPLAMGTERQFFRLVGPDVSVWFSAHSTENPECPLPAGIEVIAGDKFATVPE